MSGPDIEVRIGAIYALERIAQDSDRDRAQIMKNLCARIRRNGAIKDFSLPDGEQTTKKWVDWAAEVEWSKLSSRTITGRLGETFGEGTVTLPKDCDRPTHWPKHKLAFGEFRVEWHRWLANPNTYSPP